MHIISNIALITINETLFVQLLSFLIFLFIINRMMFRPLQHVMRERDSYIDQLKMDTLDAVNDLGSLADKLKKLESEVRIQALEKKRELEESGDLRASKIIDSARKEIEVLKEQTEMEVDHQLSEARSHIQMESEVLAINIMEKLLDRRLAS